MNEEIKKAKITCKEELKQDSSLLNSMFIMLHAIYELHSHLNILIEIREDLPHTQQEIEKTLVDLNIAKEKTNQIKQNKQNKQ